MDTLDTYLNRDYLRDQAEVDRLTKLIARITETLIGACDAKGIWPYRLVDSEQPPTSPGADSGQQRRARNASHSTTSMIAFALLASSGSDLEDTLLPAVRVRTGRWSEDERRRWETPDWLRKVRRAPYEALDAKKPQQPHATRSGTFGDDDPFTLTWLIAMGEPDPEEWGSDNEAFARDLMVWDRLIKRAWLRTGEVFRNFGLADPTSKRHLVLDQETPSDAAPGKDEPHEVPHAFQVARFVHLNSALEHQTRLNGSVDRVRIDQRVRDAQAADIEGASEARRIADSPTVQHRAVVREWLLGRVHRHLSLSALPGSAFDPAEMVLALEGYLLLGVSKDIPLIQQVLKVLTDRQETSEYWRPLLPFKATDQGAVLVPQSIEVAHALLRILDHAYELAPELFSDNLALLRRYVLWLESRAHYLRNGHDVGWESEHTYRGSEIHLWATSQALSFLTSYVAMLQRHMADVSLRAAGMVVKRPSQKPTSAVREDDSDNASALGLGSADAGTRPITGPHWADLGWLPVECGSLAIPLDQCYDARLIIRDEVLVKGVVHSMILSGPPGTGKTSLAADIASAKGYGFLVVTPSDFAGAGQEGMEARARAIFTTLGLQARTVVLFDEIDQLLLDRDSKLYRKQTSLFQLMTPGMLTKINDLVKNADNIYILATNYLDRIDPAIMRPGRFDGSYVVVPPRLGDRRQAVGTILKDWAPEELTEVLAPLALYSFADLKAMAKRAAAGPEGNAPDAPKDDERALLEQIVAAFDARLDLESLYRKRCRVDSGPDPETTTDEHTGDRAARIAMIEAVLVASVLFEEPLPQPEGGSEASLPPNEDLIRQSWSELAIRRQEIAAAPWLKSAIKEALKSSRPRVKATAERLQVNVDVAIPPAGTQ